MYSPNSSIVDDPFSELVHEPPQSIEWASSSNAAVPDDTFSAPQLRDYLEADGRVLDSFEADLHELDACDLWTSSQPTLNSSSFDNTYVSTNNEDWQQLPVPANDYTQMHTSRYEQFSDEPEQLLSTFPAYAVETPSVATTATTETAASSSASVASAPAPCRKACISCRKLKVSCSNQRPCLRCVRSGRDCVDRTLEEIAASLAARYGKNLASKSENVDLIEATSTPQRVQHKRAAASNDDSAAPSSASSHSSPSTVSIFTPASYGSSRDATDEISKHLWSQSFLAILTSVGLRDILLRFHIQLDALPLDLPSALGWQMHVTMTLLFCSHFMIPADFHTFLTQGLTQAQLESPLWISSPFAPWMRLATRPFFMVTLSTLPTIRQDLTSASASTSSGAPIFDAASPTLRVEWLPASQRAYQRWQLMLKQKVTFERQTKAEKMQLQKQNTMGQGPDQHVHDSAISSEQQPPDDVMDDVLVSGFSVMTIAATMMSSPSLDATQQDEEMFPPAHALWCPRFTVESSDATSQSAPAKKVYPSKETNSQTPTPDACICSLVTPLRQRVRINEPFTRVFGWRAVDVEQGFQRDGPMWLRHLLPASVWPTDQLHSVTHLKSHTEYLGHSTIAAAARAAGAPAGAAMQASSTAAVTVAPVVRPSPPGIDPIAVPVRRKEGNVIGRGESWDKIMKIQISTGKSEPSAIICTWQQSHDQ